MAVGPSLLARGLRFPQAPTETGKAHVCTQHRTAKNPSPAAPKPGGLPKAPGEPPNEGGPPNEGEPPNAGAAPNAEAPCLGGVAKVEEAPGALAAPPLNSEPETTTK